MGTHRWEGQLLVVLTLEQVPESHRSLIKATGGGSQLWCFCCRRSAVELLISSQVMLMLLGWDCTLTTIGPCIQEKDTHVDGIYTHSGAYTPAGIVMHLNETSACGSEQRPSRAVRNEVFWIPGVHCRLEWNWDRERGMRSQCLSWMGTERTP